MIKILLKTKVKLTRAVFQGFHKYGSINLVIYFLFFVPILFVCLFVCFFVVFLLLFFLILESDFLSIVHLTLPDLVQHGVSVCC